MKISQLVSFIREADTDKVFGDWSNQALRDHIFLCKKHKAYYYVSDQPDKPLGLIEYYRVPSYNYLATKMIKRLPLPNIRNARTIWIQHLIAGKGILRLKHLREFIKFCRPFDNIYWWKMKGNKVIICSLRRRNVSL